MLDQIQLRSTQNADKMSILEIYPQAFTEEDLVPLAQELLDLDDDIISIGAFLGDKAVAHVIYTPFKSRTDLTAPDAALLGPLCVLPQYHKMGIGRAIVQNGFEKLLARNISHVFVLGDPAYYSRLGFQPERDFNPPYPMPKEWADAWQSQTLTDVKPLGKGTSQLPVVWMDKALWLP